MTTPRHYATPLAFKQALDERLRDTTQGGNPFSRKRQILVFERFLARIALVFGEAVTLKGGLALELRLARARTTKDVDLKMTGSPDDVLERLREAALDLTFSFRKTHSLPTITPLPPTEWTGPYSNMAREDGLEWPNLASVTIAVRSFLDPILAGNLEATWVPREWKWRSA